MVQVGPWLFFVCEECDGPDCEWVAAPSAAHVHKFYVRVHGRCMCVACWRKAGRPWPVTYAPIDHRAEQEVRRAMLKRGGEDAYKVRSGGS